MNTFDKVWNDNSKHTIMSMLDDMNLSYDTYIYTNEYAFFKKTPETAFSQNIDSLNNKEIDELIRHNKLTVHNNPVIKRWGTYYVCKIGQEKIKKVCNDKLKNVKSLMIKNEQDMYIDYQELMYDKIYYNYVIAKQNDYDIYIYWRPDAYIDCDQNGIKDKMYEKYKIKLKEYFDQLVKEDQTTGTLSNEVFIRSGDKLEKMNKSLDGSVSQSHVFANKVSMENFVKMKFTYEECKSKVNICQRCKKITDFNQLGYKPVDKCFYNCSDEPYKPGQLVAEYRLYQNMFLQNTFINKSIINVQKVR